jgi:hypothetical protein
MLVEHGLLNEAQLELALVEQRRTGRLLGQIVVERGYVSGFGLARMLSAQHGVEVRADGGPLGHSGPRRSTERTEAPARAEVVVWRPLGKLLVEQGFVRESDLDQALDEQRRTGARLGEILVARGYLSGPTLVQALAEQHGVDVTIDDVPGVELETVIKPAVPGVPVFQVNEVVFEPGFQSRSVVYQSPNFLEAADFAFEYVEEHEPAALEIERTDGESSETVWTYSAGRAAAVAASRKDLVQTFGFDPTRWQGGPGTPK